MDTAIRNPARPTGRYFYTLVAAAVIAVVALGFSRSYFLRPVFHGEKALPVLLHVHGVVMSLWFVLFLVQSWLVAGSRVAAHRRLGWIAAAVGVAVLSVGTVVAIHAAANGRAPRGSSPLGFLAVPLGDLGVFAVLAGLGIFWRKRAAIHRRLMLLSNIALLPAAIARIPFPVRGPLVYFGLTDLIVLACVAYDASRRGRLHPAFGWGALFVVLSGPLRLMFGETAAWNRFASWLVN